MIIMRRMGNLISFARRHELRFQRSHSPDAVAGQTRWDGAVYSRDRSKRYAYWAVWEQELPRLLWVMLNPGTGDIEERRRNTLERVIAFSTSWGYGGALIGNVSPIRAKSAKYLKVLQPQFDPVNAEVLLLLRGLAKETVVAWGSSGGSYARSYLSALDGAKCLAVSKIGEPRHPLFLSRECRLNLWSPKGMSPA